MLTQTAVRTDQFRRFVPVPRNPRAANHPCSRRRQLSASRSRNPCT